MRKDSEEELGCEGIDVRANGGNKNIIADVTGRAAPPRPARQSRAPLRSLVLPLPLPPRALVSPAARWSVALPRRFLRLLAG